jgi:hypothetical protein
LQNPEQASQLVYLSNRVMDKIVKAQVDSYRTIIKAVVVWRSRSAANLQSSQH